MSISIQAILLITTTVYHAIANLLEDRKSPPGQLISVGKHKLHFYVRGETNPASPTIILDHSLGGVEGYLLIEKLCQLARVCIYDRAGYGWSEHSPHSRTSNQIVKELDILLTKANIEPPYILVGDSFGSYNMRLYAHLFPDKVMGIVLTDGLHETEMLKMPLQVKALKLFFLSGFLMSTVGSILGIVRIISILGIFELLIPELRNCSAKPLSWVKRSFCRPKHWITMSREMINLEKSAQQISIAKDLGQLPMVSIKSNSFFQTSLWTIFIPLKTVNQLRERMHIELCSLSSNCVQVEANKSSHFVWIDEPDLMIDVVKMLLKMIN